MFFLTAFIVSCLEIVSFLLFQTEVILIYCYLRCKIKKLIFLECIFMLIWKNFDQFNEI